MDRSSREKISEKVLALKDTLDQMDITDIYRTFLPKATEYTVFSSAHGTFYRIDHELGQKTNLSKLKRTEAYQASFLNTMI